MVWGVLLTGFLVGAGDAAPVGPEYWRAPGTTFVHLFEWPWESVARECEEVLGPRGYSAVQVSPPQEHIVLDGNPWWTRYQPVSYRIEGRSGTRAEFADMVARCSEAGVGVYVDAVVNHMTGRDHGTGSAGTRYSHYDYPGLFSPEDFHDCGRHGDNDIRNYGDRFEVQTCELLNLADLDTGAEAVRSKIAAYLQDLRAMGVAGFRVDAAKHMDAGEIFSILGGVRGVPYVFQEVIDLGGEPIRAHEYFRTGAVTEFRFSNEIGRVFDHGKLAWLHEFGEPWGFMASEKAVVFTDNHDNQRGHGGGGHVVTHRDRSVYELANAFMLAWPYGYPKVMSSYRFSHGDQGPPTTPEGRSRPVQDADGECTEGWVCEHRWPTIAAMVEFRRVVGDVPVDHWWSNGENQIAFSREGRGFVALNRQGDPLHRRFQTGLPPGDYCEAVGGGLAEVGSCAGEVLRVEDGGWLELTVPPMSVRSLHLGARP